MSAMHSTKPGFESPLHRPLLLSFRNSATASLPPRDWREIRLGPAVLGLSWVYALVAIARAWWATDLEKRLVPDRVRVNDEN